jgi:transposase
MIDYHCFCQIKHLREHHSLNTTQIAKELSLDYRTVSYWVSQERFRSRKSTNRPSKLDPFLEHIDHYLSEDPHVTVSLVYQRLLKHGFDGKYSIVRDYLYNRRDNSRLKKNSDIYPSYPELKNQEEIQEIGYIWVLRLIQGGISKCQLEKQFKDKLDLNDLNELYDTIINKPLKYRSRSASILLYLENVPQSSISRFLSIDRRTVSNYIDRYNTGGIRHLLDRRQKNISKYEQEQHKEIIFKVLHTPPAFYDINRTTWRMDDLKRIISESGFKLSKDVIRKIIKDSGYRFRKARKVLTSNDPDYQKKLEKITSILSNLGPREKFFSVDEYGPFAIKIQGGKSLVGPRDIKTIPQH